MGVAVGAYVCGWGQLSLGGVVLSRWTSLWRSKSFAWQRRPQDLTGVGHNIQVAVAPPDQLEERWDHLTLPGLRRRKKKEDTCFFFSFHSCSKQKAPDGAQSGVTVNEARRKNPVCFKHTGVKVRLDQDSLHTQRIFFSPSSNGNNCEELFEVIMISLKPILSQQPTASDFAYELTQM